MRRKNQLTRNKVQLRNRLECLLEEAHLKLSSLVSDLLGLSARRMMQAIADGETEPARLAALADRRLRATSEELRDALGPSATLNPVYRTLIQMTLEELRLLEEQSLQLDREMAELLGEHQTPVHRLAEVPGLGVDSAQQIIAEVGVSAATFPSAKHLASWVGVCPGAHESAGVSYSHRSPQGNRPMRRILCQAANAAVKTKGSVFQLLYRRLVVRLGHAQAIWAVAHRLCRLIWKILHEGVDYEERGPEVTRERSRRRIAQMVRDLRKLGYHVEPSPQAASA
jgi:transposase